MVLRCLTFTFTFCISLRLVPQVGVAALKFLPFGGTARLVEIDLNRYDRNRCRGLPHLNMFALCDHKHDIYVDGNRLLTQE
jgi:hypothetical protein